MGADHNSSLRPPFAIDLPAYFADVCGEQAGDSRPLRVAGAFRQ
jgi:hypothetical protein